VPVILAIHFLQRASRKVVVSTLFLLETLRPESVEGRRFERLRQSVPLWLQILAAVLVAWLLAQPRWVRRDSVQRIVLVLDSSISMTAFKVELQQALELKTASLEALAGTTEWQLLESDPTRPILYAGTDRGRLLQAVAAWEPHLGAHDVLPTLNLAQTHLRGSGTLVFVSDRAAQLPEGVALLAVGRPLENCGFTGVTFEGRKWQAMVRNHGRAPQTRSWWIEARGQKSPEQRVTLEPGQTAVLGGEMVEGAEGSVVVLSADAFAVDDRLPLLAPKPKALSGAVPAETPFDDFFQRLVASLENVTMQGAPADVRLAVYDPLRPAWPNGTAIVFTSDPSHAASKPLAGELVAENHPLTAGLTWNGLLCRGTLQAPAKATDQVLLWQGERPLLYLRQTGAATALVVNFDVRASNAPRLPAFVLLLHRFAERVRVGKVAPETRNVETNQLLTVAAEDRGPALTLGGKPAGVLRAPAVPGFFEVKQGERVLLTAAAQFADAREADFREAGAEDRLRAVQAQLAERNTVPDFLAPVWLVLLGAVLVGNWRWSERR
jgi:hypothetical protein